MAKRTPARDVANAACVCGLAKRADLRARDPGLGFRCPAGLALDVLPHEPQCADIFPRLCEDRLRLVEVPIALGKLVRT
jgi:hypothetical protein